MAFPRRSTAQPRARLRFLRVFDDYCAGVTEAVRRALVGPAWQQPWAVLDLWARPGQGDQAYGELLSWAVGRFAGMDRERGYPLAYWVETHEGDAGRLGLLARHGYVLDADPGLVLRHGLRGPVPPARCWAARGTAEPGRSRSRPGQRTARR
jgi:hypothetical protein